MTIYSEQLELASDGHFNVIIITSQIREILSRSKISNGQVLVFYQHTTGSVLVGEYEAGIVADWSDMLERIAPSGYAYKHHIREVDFNGHAHCRAAIMPTQVTIPVLNGKLAIGTYQDIVVIDDQVDKEPRFLIVQIMGNNDEK